MAWDLYHLRIMYSGLDDRDDVVFENKFLATLDIGIQNIVSKIELKGFLKSEDSEIRTAIFSDKLERDIELKFIEEENLEKRRQMQSNVTIQEIQQVIDEIEKDLMEFVN